MSRNDLAALQVEIAETERLAAQLRPYPKGTILHMAIGRYLWWAIQSGEVLRLALESRRPYGTEGLIRHLDETVVELALIAGWPDGPREAAALSYLWDLMDWDRSWSRWLKTADELGSEIPAKPVPRGESASQALERGLAEAERQGEDVEMVRRLWRELNDRKGQARRHWTGRPTFAARLQLLRELIADEGVQTLVAWGGFNYGRSSYALHASPRWGLVKITQGKDARWRPESRIGGIEQEIWSRAEAACAAFFNIRLATEKICEVASS